MTDLDPGFRRGDDFLRNHQILYLNNILLEYYLNIIIIQFFLKIDMLGDNNHERFLVLSFVCMFLQDVLK